MLRWLLALICLQFLLGLGVSAWASSVHPGPAWPLMSGSMQCPAKLSAPVLDVPSASAPQEAPDGAGPGSAGDTSTADSGASSVDLPDELEFQRAPSADAVLRFPCPAQPESRLASRPPYRQLRPPRA